MTKRNERLFCISHCALTGALIGGTLTGLALLAGITNLLIVLAFVVSVGTFGWAIVRTWT